MAVYYCCLEALQNATKHAGPAAHVAARLTAKNGELRLEVSDDAPGFDVAAAHTGVGLRNMEDRLGAVRGRLANISSPGNGTLISGVVPTNGTMQRPISRLGIGHSSRETNGTDSDALPGLPTRAA